MALVLAEAVVGAHYYVAAATGGGGGARRRRCGLVDVVDERVDLILVKHAEEQTDRQRERGIDR